jgi:hypothetical protein
MHLTIFANSDLSRLEAVVNTWFVENDVIVRFVTQTERPDETVISV